MKRYLVSVVAILCIGIIGCQEKGSAQKAGERADEIVDNIKKGDDPLKKKGPMEKMGDSVDDAVKGVGDNK